MRANDALQVPRAQSTSTQMFRMNVGPAMRTAPRGVKDQSFKTV
ncbi:ERBB3 isoform 5 [Pan troglodytes]|uniref:Erb-b2 receptor tyrosine kinase 3 n=2 Tax=Homininae TaxID=207598 RepID=F8VRI5_HUMAN|nr:ERBB3 isoform 5 [Pan troglodytes]